MSTLTKVFVVLLAVFSIAFTVMTVSIVAQTANWRETAQRYEQHASIADTNLRNLIAANAVSRATASDAVNSHLEQIHRVETELQEASNALAQREAELAKAASEKSSADAMNRGLVSQLEASATARTQYRDQRDELERQNVELQRRNIDLNDRVNELTALLVVLNEQKRQYEQQLHILREENGKLAQATRRQSVGATLEDPAGAAMTQVNAATATAAAAIRAEVIEVSSGIVTISAGSADGVQKSMVFVIHRNGDYVGDLRIDLVDPDESAGRVVRSAFAPRVGDSVTDANWLGTSRG